MYSVILTSVKSATAVVFTFLLFHSFLHDILFPNVPHSEVECSPLLIFSIDHVVLGGCHQEGNYDKDIDEEDSKIIFERCCRLIPSLKVSYFPSLQTRGMSIASTG